MTRGLSLFVSLSLLCAVVSAQRLPSHITQASLPSLPYVNKNGNHFNVLADEDTIAPTVGGFTFNPKTLDYAQQGTNNRVTIQGVVFDNTGGSGVVSVSAAWVDPSGNYTYRTTLNLQTPPFFPPAQNGTWGGTFTVPNYQLTGLPKNGTWSLINITAIDLAGNVALYSRGKAQESGFPTSFEVHLPSPMACLDVSYPTAQVDVKKADNPSQMATVPFNCTTTAAPANSNTLRCYVYFQCYDENWVSGTGTPRAPSLTDFTGTMQIVDWYYETGACNLEGIITSYNGPSGGTIMELYGRADPLTMRLLFPDAAATVLASPLVLLLSFALAFFLAK